MLRAVLDSNVVLAAHGAAHPLSPNREIIQRWSVGEFIWLVTADIAAEYAEKLLDKGQAPQAVEAFIAGLFLMAECIEIRFVTHLKSQPFPFLDPRPQPQVSGFRSQVSGLPLVTCGTWVFSMKSSPCANQRYF